MSRSWILGDTVHAVMIGADAVFLDIRSDAYVSLPGAGQAMAFDEDGVGLDVNDPLTASALADRGLIRPRPSVGPPARRQPPPLPAASALPGETAPLRWRDLPDLVHALVDLLLHYRNRALADLLRTGGDRHAAGPYAADPSPKMLLAVARFHRWAPWAPVSGKCLLRSFMLLRFLKREGFDAQWVFAVRTWPFAAHCWLQCGEVVLDDDFERLAAFHPILAA
ncbi:MAG TPA: lasso peptide biosynthesis B2 protein [Phenylobacterium sp.]|jgi:hypothetical protein|nr:lasso peptide biosynthesis B2 protein [Phenylobacterium sp.]